MCSHCREVEKVPILLRTPAFIATWGEEWSRLGIVRLSLGIGDGSKNANVRTCSDTEGKNTSGVGFQVPGSRIQF